ncbi:hypothetical protein [Amycolatopsis antarctica]|uniref:hypothetical protein n=1 Tax=Amycolatopsis antarctica TaxID=1854586 RepID=UPI0013FE25B3|nr:hypothetical protein [Amycolatopsis antarctica]
MATAINAKQIKALVEQLATLARNGKHTSGKAAELRAELRKAGRPDLADQFEDRR